MAKVEVNEQYSVAVPDSLVMRIAAILRRRMYQRFLRDCAVMPDDSILDVGATSEESYDTSNYLEAWYPHRHRITAVGLDDAHAIEQRFPGVTFQKADGRNLPFPDRSFDVVHSSAVLEHVGSRDQQRRFISELARVARRAAFLTTPNRWFPIEVHSLTPLLHWLPAPAFRRCLSALGHDALAKEENLNLLGAADLRQLCREAGLADAAVSGVSFAGFLGWPSNLVLLIRRS